MIVIDWGTTNLRAYLCSENGTIIDRKSSPRGIKSLSCADYPGVLSELVEFFAVEKPLAVFISGMAGSRNGWIEAPYCSVPTRIEDLKAALVELPGTVPGQLVPGIRVVKDDLSSDVIRGEEVQVFGALHHLGLSSGLLCLPGTHSKWVRVTDNTITDFSTFMTGDVFQGLGQTILGCDPGDAFHDEAFKAGLQGAETIDGGLLHQLFTGRTRLLDGQLDSSAVSSYISGLLIGHELLNSIGQLSGPEPVVIIGSDKLCESYQLALEERKISAISLGSDVATCKGVAALLSCEEAFS